MLLCYTCKKYSYVLDMWFISLHCVTPHMREHTRTHSYALHAHTSTHTISHVHAYVHVHMYYDLYISAHMYKLFSYTLVFQVAEYTELGDIMARLASDSKTDLNSFTMERYAYLYVYHYQCSIYLFNHIAIRLSQNTRQDTFISIFQ